MYLCLKTLDQILRNRKKQRQFFLNWDSKKTLQKQFKGVETASLYWRCLLNHL